MAAWDATDLAATVARISDSTQKTAVSTAISDCWDALYAVVVTTVGYDASSAEWLDLEQTLRELGRQAAESISDYSA